MGAVFVFPLTVGAIRGGEMGLYRGLSRPADREQFGECLILADAATVFLLDDAGAT